MAVYRCAGACRQWQHTGGPVPGSRGELQDRGSSSQVKQVRAVRHSSGAAASGAAVMVARNMEVDEGHMHSRWCILATSRWNMAGKVSQADSDSVNTGNTKKRFDEMMPRGCDVKSYC